jgi:hypothetical protein
MVVVICSIVILYMVAEQRLNELPAAAERANFYAILEQVKTGMNFEMITHVANRDFSGINAMTGTNPMLFLLDTPRNYRGELEEVTDANATRRSWYFETSTGQLVYVVGGPSIEDVRVTIGGIPVNLGQIRFRIENVIENENTEDGSAPRSSRSSWQGLQLRPARPFEWERRPETPVEI